jgi:CubicO group peptidase (beta-lactamase class C family)
MLIGGLGGGLEGVPVAAAAFASQPQHQNEGSRQQESDATTEPQRPLPRSPRPPGMPAGKQGANATGKPERAPRMQLPVGAVLDPCMGNSTAVRSGVVPSYGGFSSARGLARAVFHTLFEKLSPGAAARLASPEPGSPVKIQTSPLLGRCEWALGWQRYSLDGLPVLVRHAFGGSLVLVVPERQLVLTVLVNCLTLDRAVVRDVVQLVARELMLPAATVHQLFGGVF